MTPKAGIAVSSAVSADRARGLTHSTMNGLLWALVGTGSQALLQLVVLTVLARLLGPGTFGVVTAALVVVGFTSIFSQLGVGPALVQYPGAQLSERHVRTAFTITMALGILVMAVVAAGAPLVAGFFRMPELRSAVQALSLMFVLQAFSVVPESLLQKELRFRTLALVEVAALALGYGLVGIGMALAGFGLAALIAANLAQAAFKTVLLVVVVPHPKRPLLDRRATADLVHFGGGFTLARVGNYFGVQGDNLVVGRLMGAVPLGVYGRAYQLMAAPAGFFGQILDRVLFPAMVKVQDRRDRLALAYRRGVALIALIVLPSSAVLMVLSSEIVNVLLGSSWTSVVLPLQVFAFGMLFRTSYKMSDSLARATGAVYRRAWRQGLYASLVILGAWCGTIWGLPGVAVGVVAALAVNFLAMAHLSSSLTAISWREFGDAHRPGAALAAVVGIQSALLALLLRRVEVAPIIILALVSPAAAATALLLLRRAPRLFLGRDGRWMLQSLREYLPARFHGLVEFGEDPFPGPHPVATGAAHGAPAAPAALQPLAIVRSLALEFDREGVAYCHWKSNEHVLAGARGETDLDILVDRAAMAGVLRALGRTGFKRFAAVTGLSYAGIDDYLGFDPETGCLVHLHLHARLMIGRPFLKEFHLPWESAVLASRLRDAETGLFIADPHLEILLLVVRAALKWRWRDGLRALLRGAALSGDMQRELRFLRGRITEARLCVVADDLLGGRVALEARALALDGPTASGLRRLARDLRTMQPLGAAESRWRAAVRGFGRECIAVRAAVVKRYLSPARPLRRVLPQGGVLVALVGSDGSGKSTLARDLTAWLSWKIDARLVYFGTGDGPSSLVRLPLKLMLPLGRRLSGRGPGAGRTAAGPDTRPGGGPLAACLRAVWALAVAREKRARLRLAWRARQRGLAVICDRYPQAQIPGFNDGPLLSSWLKSRSGLLRRLALWEAAPYRWADERSPDLVIKLKVTPGVAQERKPDMRLDELSRRVRAIEALSYRPETRVDVVDADQPFVEVRRQVRELVWRAL